MLDLASRLIDIEFNEDQVDGGVEGVCCNKEEDMIVNMCYVGECVTFNKTLDMELFNPMIERQKILDIFLQLLNFV